MAEYNLLRSEANFDNPQWRVNPITGSLSKFVENLRSVHNFGQRVNVQYPKADKSTSLKPALLVAEHCELKALDTAIQTQFQDVIDAQQKLSGRESDKEAQQDGSDSVQNTIQQRSLDETLRLTERSLVTQGMHTSYLKVPQKTEGSTIPTFYTATGIVMPKLQKLSFGASDLFSYTRMWNSSASILR